MVYNKIIIRKNSILKCSFLKKTTKCREKEEECKEEQYYLGEKNILKKEKKQKGRGLFSDLRENAKYIFNSWKNYSKRNSLLNVHVP